MRSARPLSGHWAKLQGRASNIRAPDRPGAHIQGSCCSSTPVLGPALSAPLCGTSSRTGAVTWSSRRPWRLPAARSDDAGDGGLEAAFAQELAARLQSEAATAEEAAAKQFNGTALLALLKQKYSRSYDCSLVQRVYMGKRFVALNIMWKYMEQASFAYSKEEYMQRLDYIAAVLVSWGVVKSVQTQVTATKERPRVGKAVSIMLDVPDDKFKEWLNA